jgi:hypothetical protein
MTKPAIIMLRAIITSVSIALPFQADRHQDKYAE